MASLIETLINVLDKENTEYEKLLVVLKTKTTLIVKGEIDVLQELLVEEQQHIDRINKLDEERLESVRDICDVLNLPLKTTRIEDVIRVMSRQPKEQESLRAVHLKLKKTLDQVIKINENNKMMIKESMEMIEFEMNIAKSVMMAPQNANYSRSAFEQNNVSALGRFDAKQ